MKTTIDMTGVGGMAPRHYEDSPNELYVAGQGQMASGIYNPFKKHGYMSPASNSITACTGTITNEIVCSDYDSVNDDLYFGGGNILLNVDGLADTSVVTALTIDADRDIIDTEIYEVNSQRVLAYATDTSDIGDSMSIGFLGLDNSSGISILNLTVIDSEVINTYETIGNSDTNEKLSQKIENGTDANTTYRDVDRIRVRLSRLGVGTSYTIKVGLQRTSDTSSTSPDGTFIASGTVDPSTIAEVTGEDVNGQDVYVDLDAKITLDSSKYWVVVEPTTIGDMTGTNSFVWYRSDYSNSMYAAGDAYAYDGSVWSTADDTAETFDCSLISSDVENWFPAKDSGILTFAQLGTDTHATTGTHYSHSTAIYWDETHFIGAWEGDANDGFVQTFSITSSGTIAEVGTALEYDIVSSGGMVMSQISSTRFIGSWQQSGTCYVQCFAVNASTFAITASGSPLSIGSTIYPNSIAVIDTSNAILIYGDSTNTDTTSQLLSLDGSFNVTTNGTAVDLDTGGNSINYQTSAIKQLTGVYYVAVWGGTDGDGFVQIIDVNTGTGTITTHGTAVEFETSSIDSIGLVVLDSTHFLLSGSINTVGEGVSAQCYAIDGSYNITSTGTGIVLDRNSGTDVTLAEIVTGERYVVSYDFGDNGYVSGFEIDESYNIVSDSTYVSVYSTSNPDHAQMVAMSTKMIVIIYDIGDNDGRTMSMSLDKVFSEDNFYIEEGQISFLRKADNGLLYWFTGSRVHSLDGSFTGGLTGIFSQSLLAFPSYMECVDAVDTRGFLYIATHSNTSTTGSTDNRKFSSNVSGVYVWDRQSTVVRTRDFFPVQGAREIRNIFLSKDGDILLITISNSGYSELRILSGNKFVVIAKMDIDGYPKYSDSITYVDNLVTWQGVNGINYSYGSVEVGEKPALYKIGDLSGNAAGTFSSGILTQAHSTSTSPSVGSYASWRDNTTNKLSKWYPLGEGTIDSVVQKANTGNVYSPVKMLPPLSTINFINLYNLPIATSDATDMGDIKIYFNQSTTPWATKQITKADIAKGVFYIPVDKPWINSVQVEIEWDTAVTLGSDIWCPVLAEIDYTQTRAINRQKQP